MSDERMGDDRLDAKELTKIRRWRADEACEPAEAPMRRRDGQVRAWEHKREPFCISRLASTRTALLSTVAFDSVRSGRTRRRTAADRTALLS